MTAPLGFNVCVFHRPELTGSRAFDELAQTYCLALRALGYSAELSENRLRADALNILFGVNLFRDHAALRLPANVVIVNLEQYTPESMWFTPGVLATYRNNVVWDYSQANVVCLRQAGCEDIHLVPVGTVPEMTRIPARAQDIDVLHYGWISPRRDRALRAVRAAGLNVVALNEIYGAQRDQFIARSRTVLQVRTQPYHKIFEIVRASYLMANGKAIVSEWDEETEVEPGIMRGVRWARYEDLPDACATLCADASARDALGETARAVMAERWQGRYLQAAIAGLPDRVFPTSRGDATGGIEHVRT